MPQLRAGERLQKCGIACQMRQDVGVPDVAVQSTLSAEEEPSKVLNSCMSTWTQVCDDPIENILSI